MVKPIYKRLKKKRRKIKSKRKKESNRLELNMDSQHLISEIETKDIQRSIIRVKTII